MSEIILIDLENFQEYIIYNIKQLKLLNFNNITIITTANLKNYFENLNVKIILTDEFNLDTFDKLSSLDNVFRNGFWRLASKRLFYLYQYIKKYEIKDCFHIENDVLMYRNINIPDKTKIWLTIDNENRCIPGILFIPEYRFLDNLFSNYFFDRNDMENLAIFYNNNKNICETFPIISQNSKINDYNKNFYLFNMIFDAAAIGQYLGGVDPRNISGDTRGFVNETCRINYSNYNFKWKLYKEDTNLYLPYIEINNEDIPIANLHIHCKRLKDFTSDYPTETKLIPYNN